MAGYRRANKKEQASKPTQPSTRWIIGPPRRHLLARHRRRIARFPTAQRIINPVMPFIPDDNGGQGASQSSFCLADRQEIVEMSHRKSTAYLVATPA
jgi:hypothetical protein